jgi:hypothetical protein
MRSCVQVLERASCRNAGKGCVIRPKVVRPFPGPSASGSYDHQAALLFIKEKVLSNVRILGMSLEQDTMGWA